MALFLMKQRYGLRMTFTFLMKIVKSPTQRKYLWQWIDSLQLNYLLNKPLPWLNFEAIQFITKRLSTNPYVFEYGSGGSTLYWLSKGARCISIEHDPAWYKLLLSNVRSDRLDYRLIIPETISSSDVDIAEPTAYLSSDEQYAGYTFRNYASQIDEFPEKSFDLVMIDGRARPSCIMHSVNKVKSQGMLILDNADRQYYTQKTSKWLSGFERHSLIGLTPSLLNYTQTDVYVRS